MSRRAVKLLARGLFVETATSNAFGSAERLVDRLARRESSRETTARVQALRDASASSSETRHSRAKSTRRRYRVPARSLSLLRKRLIGGE